MMFPKPSTIRDRDYLDALRDMPCIVTGHKATDWLAIDPSHIGTKGRGVKSDDCHALPLRHDLHGLLHSKGEASFWREHLPDDVLLLCLKAYAKQNYEEWKK